MRILLPLALLALALSTPLSAGAGFVVVAPYALAPPVCAEGACAPIPGREHTLGPFAADHFVAASLSDASTLPVGATYRLVDALGGTLTTGSFCGTLSNLWFPAGTRLTVRIDAPQATQHCPDGLGGTYGTATYTFTTLG